MKILKKFKNIYLLTTVVFVVYILFLDDVDVFTIVRKEIRLNELKQEVEDLTIKYKEVKTSLTLLDDTKELERYARENKMFKKDDEDIFVISYEK
ncbi:MAG: septum formation initiator family protein [Brumimicrobium sp.]|nr:septum formation initiator family protein [Brumimicrobium sp.]